MQGYGDLNISPVEGEVLIIAEYYTIKLKNEKRIKTKTKNKTTMPMVKHASSGRVAGH